MAQAKQNNDRITLTTEDWEREALDLIAEKGITALAVEPLARRMGITKGSFYWHFTNREALLGQSLKRWEEHDARNLSSFFADITGPRERLVTFFRRVSRERFTHDVYNALLGAANHPSVEPLLERVAKRRMKYLAEAFRQLGIPGSEAKHRARLAYTAYIGFLQLQRQQQTPSKISAEFEAYIEHVIETLIPGAGADG